MVNFFSFRCFFFGTCCCLLVTLIVSDFTLTLLEQIIKAMHANSLLHVTAAIVRAIALNAISYCRSTHPPIHPFTHKNSPGISMATESHLHSSEPSTLLFFRTIHFRGCGLRLRSTTSSRWTRERTTEVGLGKGGMSGARRSREAGVA